LAEPVKQDPSSRRRYDASRRREQARATQLTVLRAARDLFIANGYGRTTVADVARAAGVSPELIYATFRNKPTLLHRAWDITIGGDDEDVMFHDRPEVQQIRAEPDLARRFMMHARLFTATARRITPFMQAMQGAAGSEPVAADMLAEIGRQRFEGLGIMAREAAATGQLAVDEQECRAVVWAMTDGSLWQRLVVERGWSDERFADWLGRTWVAMLVAAPTRRPSRRR
jgi:AcrR family transcriptional regulator